MSGHQPRIKHLAFAARKTTTRPDFLGFYLSAYQHLERLNEEDMLRLLNCHRENLYRLALARAPDPEASSFGTKLCQIAEWAEVSALELARMLKRVHALSRLEKADSSIRRDHMLAAARDRDHPESPRTEEKNDR
ncbi:MAG: hypothetical protein M3P51_12675 [Chloroflexota bacterium]|nr:hypothetical protein [Chloroflexota bacterium]